MTHDTEHQGDRLRSVCPECGDVFDRFDKIGSCTRCQPARRGNDTEPRRTGSTTERGYGGRWQRLSRRARQLQPFCTDCGSTHDLTADHSPEAWIRHDKGLAVRLVDIEVVCRRCNSERGAARGDTTTDRHNFGRPAALDQGDSGRR